MHVENQMFQWSMSTKSLNHFLMSVCVDRVYPAVIAGETSVRSGADVDFRCTSEDAPDTGLLLAFLWRNQTIVDIEMWNSQQKQASFHLIGVQERDSGNYSCVVSERPLAATELDMCGGNSVFLQVYGKNCKNINTMPQTKVRQ